MTETQDRPFGQRLKRGIETKVLIPVASAIVGAAAKYLIKKLPLILEEKLLPKLVEKDAPQPVVKALEQTASTLGDDSGSKAEPAGDESPTGAQQAISNDEREEERRKRAQRRRQRKSASAKAA